MKRGTKEIKNYVISIYYELSYYAKVRRISRIRYKDNIIMKFF